MQTRRFFPPLRGSPGRRGGHLLAAMILAAAGAAAMGGLAPAEQVSERVRRFDTAPLAIVTGGGRHDFTVEIASTDAERAQGLMFRRTLPAGRGMLFLYRSPRLISMWMKNTYIPLDMIFIGAEGAVVSVHERAVPHSLAPISSGRRAVAVLEVPGGTVARLGIRVGDRVVNRFLGEAR